ncbi:hypothetical protein [Gluconacetobacter asukensis]|uniref:Uncharacterized protein n=1 Tax=Gluconacetobacter asukensis TaxID=1017181 RepID=A0A7W4J1M6_9PROT|nr:hypothetical protein [Gluconacetobacter asukensis]MBB2172853.1 hypothetical protein [Gluconacetobacter asukensis]
MKRVRLSEPNGLRQDRQFRVTTTFSTLFARGLGYFGRFLYPNLSRRVWLRIPN